MRILALSDQECPWLWDYLDRRRLEGVDLILSCGDLDPRYLSFIVTFAHAPVLYVHGNHDDRYADVPPEGCICVEDKLYTYQGVRILGLGGCMRYKQSGGWTGGYADAGWTCSARAGLTSCSPTPPLWASTTARTCVTPASTPSTA